MAFVEVAALDEEAIDDAIAEVDRKGLAIKAAEQAKDVQRLAVGLAIVGKAYEVDPAQLHELLDAALARLDVLPVTVALTTNQVMRS